MLRSSAGVDVPAVRFPFVRELLWRQCRGSGQSCRRVSKCGRCCGRHDELKEVRAIKGGAREKVTSAEKEVRMEKARARR